MIHQNLSAADHAAEQLSKLFLNLAALHSQKEQLRKLYSIIKKSDSPNRDLWLRHIQGMARKVDQDITRLNNKLIYGVY